jgi:hypothetical protein
MSSSEIFAMVARTSNGMYRTVGACYVPVYIEQDHDEYLRE